MYSSTLHWASSSIRAAKLYPRSRTADNYPRQIRFYPRKPLGFGVILSTNYGISVFSYRQHFRQGIGSVSADLAANFHAHSKHNSLLFHTNLYYNNYTYIYVYIHNNIHNITVSLFLFTFQSPLSLYHILQQMSTAISNLTENYISETVFHFVTKSWFRTSLLLLPIILLGYTYIPEFNYQNNYYTPTFPRRIYTR